MEAESNCHTEARNRRCLRASRVSWAGRPRGRDRPDAGGPPPRISDAQCSAAWGRASWPGDELSPYRPDRPTAAAGGLTLGCERSAAGIRRNGLWSPAGFVLRSGLGIVRRNAVGRPCSPAVLVPCAEKPCSAGRQAAPRHPGSSRSVVRWRPMTPAGGSVPTPARPPDAAASGVPLTGSQGLGIVDLVRTSF